MRTFIVVVLGMLSLSVLSAQDPPKVNTLSTTEVTDGWLLLFDSESTFGWTALEDSKWEVKDGVLTCEKAGTLATTTAWQNYEFSADFRLGKRDSAELRLTADDKGKTTKDATILMPGKADEWWHVKLNVNEGRVRELWALAKSPDNPAANRAFLAAVPEGKSGRIALVCKEGLSLRNIKIRPLGTRAIFNGKDLKGWKTFKGDKYKSTFDVDNEGVLVLKDGPGDLQTEGQWANFILQLECKTNGRGLNSGVFFRCIPNEYQNGYEAQIHNGFEKEPKEYTVDEFDPKTHEKTGTKKVMSAASDFGSGAIYRRIPARKQAAIDRVWFTMTVYADGNHFATWVNGVQMVDWIDNRALKDNPRQGCRLEKGPISLQGHDPTTDLNFRNLRLVELPSGK